ncbi:MAG: NADAR family protein [Gammaproteobacteria bacterium]|nr:NADAR family protein [Gammaproteobacteria bacterium]
MTQQENKRTAKFYGFRTPLCNLRICKVRMNGVEFNSVEQLLNAKKAEHFNDYRAWDRIMNTRTPIDTRWVKVHNFDKEEWGNAVHQILLDALLAKFNQHEGCRRYLLKTTGTRLAYCDPKDQLLGTGVDRFSPEADDPAKWTGENLVGETLMKVRDILRADPLYAEEVKAIEKEASGEMARWKKMETEKEASGEIMTGCKKTEAEHPTTQSETNKENIHPKKHGTKRQRAKKVSSSGEKKHKSKKRTTSDKIQQ